MPRKTFNRFQYSFLFLLLLFLSYTIRLEGFINWATIPEKDNIVPFSSLPQFKGCTGGRSYFFHRLISWATIRINIQSDEDSMMYNNEMVYTNYDYNNNVNENSNENEYQYQSPLSLKKEVKGKYMLVNDHAYLMQNLQKQQTYKDQQVSEDEKQYLERGEIITKATKLNKIYVKNNNEEEEGERQEESKDNNGPPILQWDFISEGEERPYPYFGVFVSMSLLMSIVILISCSSG